MQEDQLPVNPIEVLFAQLERQTDAMTRDFEKVMQDLVASGVSRLALFGAGPGTGNGYNIYTSNVPDEELDQPINSRIERDSEFASMLLSQGFLVSYELEPGEYSLQVIRHVSLAPDYRITVTVPDDAPDGLFEDLYNAGFRVRDDELEVVIKEPEVEVTCAPVEEIRKSAAKKARVRDIAERAPCFSPRSLK